MYVGHTSEDGRLQLLLEHLQSVGKLAGEYGESFGVGEYAKIIGLCHDIGKYSDAAQDRLLRNGNKVDHSTAGGKVLSDLIGPAFSYPIFGHHSGLPDGGTIHDTGEDASMFGRLKKTKISDYSVYKNELILEKPKPLKFPLLAQGFSVAFLIRMLFSCLVDADFIDTERFMNDKHLRADYQYDSIRTLSDTLFNHLEKFKNPQNDINKKRNEILNECITKAKNTPGLFSLTVPTGGGKTLASLAFALNHAKEHGMDRVIYVIPYTSIIEQNANVFAEILGYKNVLEHHSNVNYDNNDTERSKKHLASENWDAPIIVTTNVQFFESFFSARTSKCRKLHNVSNSVIIFDEAQMLPINYLQPCVSVISELVYSYNSTAVLCSATQPALDQFLSPQLVRNEICQNPKSLYEFFKRTTIKNLGEVEDGELVEKLKNQKRVLCIVNTRKQAQNLHAQLEGHNCFHLSTLMIPKHRKATLDKIREKLNKGAECRVISTSLIEAGVDLDFPVVYRAHSGLDSIIQAAGRCNREGKRKADESFVYVFLPDRKYVTPIAHRRSGEIFRDVASKYEDVSSLEAIEEYFKLLYKVSGEGLDEKKIIKQFNDGLKSCSYPFKTVSEEFKLIPDSTYGILIPYDEEGKQIIDKLRLGVRNREIIRCAGQYTVNVYENHYRTLFSMGIIEKIDDEFSVLLETSSYSEDTGLTLSPEGGKAVFFD